MRSSGLTVGAVGAAAALRREVVDTGLIDAHPFDEAFAVSRLTPGTNLLAFYVLLGRHIAGWRGALQALLLGTLIPSVIVCALAAAYAHVADSPLAAHAMRGARAGALAVLLWAAVQLVRPQLARHPVTGTLLGCAALVATVAFSAPPVVTLLIGGVVGAVYLGAE